MTNEELVYLYQNGDKQALEKLLEKNKGIVCKIVNKFYVDGINSIDKEDLEQEGYIGLITASERYDFNNEKKAQFITYAVHWIYSKINQFIKRRNTNDETSLNTPTGENGDTELLDYIEGVDYSFENIENKIYNQQLRQELEEVMKDRNSLKEREVLKLRHGWDTNKPMTLKEVGEIFDTNIERVRRIENKALRKIRHSKWGRVKAMELYREKLSYGHYNIDKALEIMNYKIEQLKEEKNVPKSISFAERYLGDVKNE